MKRMEKAESWDEVVKLKGRAEQLRILDALPNEVEQTIEAYLISEERGRQTQERKVLETYAR